MSKAFDRVRREGLFYLIWNNGVEEKVWRLLQELYSILSPSLFSVMMKDLTDMLSEHNIGVPIAS